MIKFQDDSSHSKPNFYKKHKEDGGFDILSDENIWLMPHESAIIETNLKIDLPFGKSGIIKGKSGMCFNHDIVVDQDGTIDPGYEGYIKVKLRNNGSQKFEINKGDKVAQMLIVNVYTGDFVKVKEIESKSTRGDGGYGSTGK